MAETVTEWGQTFSEDNLPAQTFTVDPEQNIDVSICLVNWNTCDLLRECLQSIYDTIEDLKLEVFVIDNASSDDSIDMVRSEFPDVYLVENIRNLGFAKANNQGINLSTGRHVFLLNPDTLLHTGALQVMVSFLDAHPTTGAVAARLLNTDGTLQYSVRRFPTVLTPFTENTNLARLPGISKYSEKSRLTDWNHDEIKEVEQPAGAAFMIKRHVLETLGPLNSCYHMFFEDVDLCYRIRDNGWKVFYLPEAVVTHHGGQSVKKRTDMGFQFYRSLIKYFQNQYGASGVLKVRLCMLVFSLYCIGYALFEMLWSPASAFLTGKSAVNVIRAAFFKVPQVSPSTGDSTNDSY